MLPEAMRSREAAAFLLAIGLQESRFEHRDQIGGPAKGFWQFEEGGGWMGVLSHSATQDTAYAILEQMSYRGPVFGALSNNDVLACSFARLLLWTYPLPLPGELKPYDAWVQYIDVWRPGKPHPETWADFWKQAWQEVK